MASIIKDEAMIELLLNLHPPLTVNEIKKILPDHSFEKDKDIGSILNELNFKTESAATITLFKALVLQKRGRFKDELRKKTESYFRDEVGVDTYQMDRTIGKGKTVLNIDILGRKVNKDICAFILDDDMDIDSFESFKTMLTTILSYAKVSPVEIFLILPKVIVKKELIDYIKSKKTLKYVKTSGAELSAQFKPIIYESEIPRTSLLTLQKEDIFGDKIDIGTFSGSNFLDKEDLQNFLVKTYGDYGEGRFTVKLLDHLTNKTKSFTLDTTSKVASDVTEIIQTIRYEETR